MLPNSLFTHRIPTLALVNDRQAFIANACKNRSVLHLGCAAWPFTRQSLSDGSLLHMTLEKVSKRVVGIDISEEGLSLLRSAGFVECINWDVEKLDELQIDEPIEIIVAGEILEHLSNPGLCLRSISQFMKHHRSVLLVSVPNAFCLRRLVTLIFRRTELVHPEHTAYYSVATLSELLRRYHLNIRELYAYSDLTSASTPLKRFVKLAANASLFRFAPQISEGIIAIAESSDERCSQN